MINSRSLITLDIIRSEIALAIQVPAVGVDIKQTWDQMTDACCVHVTAKGAKGCFEFHHDDLTLSLDDFSLKHITPYVARVYGLQARAGEQLTKKDDDKALKLEILKLALDFDHLSPEEIIEIAAYMYKWVAA